MLEDRTDPPAAPELRVEVRGLRPDDFDAVVTIDERNVGRRREEFFRIKLAENLAAAGIRVSLAAEVDGVLVGFLLARVFYGEFGRTEPSAALDTLAVYPNLHGLGIGHALLAQLRLNLSALGVASIQTEVSWDDQALLAFFHREGFRPAPRLALDLEVVRP
ncbi:MAG: putative acetyltransferase [Acidobacteria bacterium]|jgi:ribosomal protein S18 acetylase RimI-like enzyme|nr:putative acetyltransferase [Acidobacteriota bacterium]